MATKATAVKATRAPRGTLSPELVQSAALRIIDAEGLDALTMRRLADELSVKTMSIYSHVLSKESLLESIKDELFRQVAQELAGIAPADRGWIAQLRRVFDVVHRKSIEHPSLIPLLVSVPSTPASTARGNADRATLESAGFDTDGAQLALKTLVAHLVGSILIGYGPADVESEECIDARDAGSAASYFDFGLNVILEGLTGQLATAKREGAIRGRKARASRAAPPVRRG